MKNLFIVDFSKTLTDSSNPTTWSVFAKSGILWEEYIKDRNSFYDEFHKYELDWNLAKTKRWWWEHMNLFKKYWLSIGIIREIVKKDEYFKPRQWLKKFIEFTRKNDIELYIVSSWVWDFIREFLEYHNLNTENIKIYWNKLNFDENWIVSWYKESTIITPLNKKEHKFRIDDFNKVVLLWDDVTDLDMYSWECLKIWFNEIATWFDINLWKNWDLKEVIDIYNNLK